MDVVTGELVTKRVRLNTPKPATVEAVVATIKTVVDTVATERPLEPDLPVGCGLPCVIKKGTALTAANIDKGWIGTAADELIGAALGHHVLVINDADAAAIAEVAPWRRPRRARDGAAADDRHRDRQRPAGRWPAGSEHGARPSRVPGQGRRDDAQWRGSRAAAPPLEVMGTGVRRLSRPRRALPVARRDHPRRRCQQGHGEVQGISDRPRGRRAGQVPEYVRDHRRRQRVAASRCRPVPPLSLG